MIDVPFAYYIILLLAGAGVIGLAAMEVKAKLSMDNDRIKFTNKN